MEMAEIIISLNCVGLDSGCESHTDNLGMFHPEERHYNIQAINIEK